MADSENRTKQIHLFVTERESALIKSRAQASGLGLSAYIRRCALSGNAPSPATDARDLKPLYTELRRCGNNVNQIARALNAHGANSVSSAEISTALAALAAATDSVAKALSESRGAKGAHKKMT